MRELSTSWVGWGTFPQVRAVATPSPQRAVSQGPRHSLTLTSSSLRPELRLSPSLVMYTPSSVHEGGQHTLWVPLSPWRTEDAAQNQASHLHFLFSEQKTSKKKGMNFTW